MRTGEVRRTDGLVCVLLAVVVGTVYYGTIRPGHDWGGDFSQYIAHARNLATGRPYLETTYRELPASIARAFMPGSYPPVLPLMLAPVYRVFGLNYVALKLVGETALLASALLYYLIARLRGLRPLFAAAAVMAYATSATVLDVKESILSEPEYLMWVGAAIAAALLIDRRRWDETHPVAAGAVVGGMIFLAYGTRAAGLSLVIAFASCALMRKRRLWIYSLAAGAIFAIGFLISLKIYSPREYDSSFGFSPTNAVQNAISFIKAPASMWRLPQVLRVAMVALMTALAGWQFVKAVVRRRTIVEFYVMASLIVLLAYSHGIGARYVLPLFPIYLIFAFESVQNLQEKVSSWSEEPSATGRPILGSLVSMVMVAVIVAGAAVNVHGMETGPYAQGVAQKTFLDAVSFLKDRGAEGGRLVSWNPRVLALYTNLESVWYPETSDDGILDSYFSEVNVRRILIYKGDEGDMRYLAPHISQESAHFKLEFHNVDFEIYSVAP